MKRTIVRPKQERQGRAREANYRDAMAALIAMLDDRLRSVSKVVEDDLRHQQIGSGMRGDKRRTYRFQDDVVVCNIVVQVKWRRNLRATNSH